MIKYTSAIVRQPGKNFKDGLKRVDLGVPDLAKALKQHAQYCDALQRCGLKLTMLEADPRYPDGAFIEDAAIITDECVVLSSFRFPSRQGEEGAIKDFLPKRDFYEKILPPATLEGGDVMRVGKRFFIGQSGRTNREGAQILGEILEKYGYAWSAVPVTEALHLTTGATWIGGDYVVAVRELAEHLQKYEWLNIITAPEEERYAANCLHINGAVIMPAGFPKTRALIEQAIDVEIIEVEMNEFEKMDGGLTCLSLRF